MRAIVHTVKRDGPTVKRVGYLANKKTLIGDWLGNDIRLNAERLVEAHHGKGRKTRHFIVSLEQGADLPDEQLSIVAERFATTFAPGSAWLGAVDRDTKAVHVHLLVCNSDGERTINFSPSVLQRMQSVADWSGGVLQDGRRGAVLAKLTTARQLKEMTYDQIQSAIATGALTVGRRSKQGVVTSVVLGGRRVRLSTVQRAAAATERHPEHRDADVSTAGVDVRLDARPGDAPHPSGRRPRPGDRARSLGQPGAERHRPKATPGTRTQRDRPSILFQGSQILPHSGQSLRPAIPPVARNPAMGGRGI